MTQGTSTETDESVQFVLQLTQNDVLLGRGAPSVDNEGNRRFRKIVQVHKEEYSSTSKHQYKAWIANKVIKKIKAKKGRFLRKIESLVEAESMGVPAGHAAWAVVDDDTIIVKVKQALRDQNSSGKRRRESVSSEPPRKRRPMVIPTAASNESLDSSYSTTSDSLGGFANSLYKQRSAAKEAEEEALSFPERQRLQRRRVEALVALQAKQVRSDHTRAILGHIQGLPMLGGAPLPPMPYPSSTEVTLSRMPLSSTLSLAADLTRSPQVFRSMDPHHERNAMYHRGGHAIGPRGSFMPHEHTAFSHANMFRSYPQHDSLLHHFQARIHHQTSPWGASAAGAMGPWSHFHRNEKPLATAPEPEKLVVTSMPAREVR